MNKFFSFFLLAGLCTLSACGEAPRENKTTPKQDYPEVFDQVLAAHGGLDTWESMHTLTFDRESGNNIEQHTIALKSRKSLIEVPGRYRLGSDGDKVWVSPHRDSFPGNSPRFTHNLHFYFSAIPFVFTDPGVLIEDGGTETVDSVEYKVVHAKFEDNIGDAPEDQYNLYVNPSTHVIDFITYSVTYFDKSRANSFNALRYDWKSVNGLLAPTSYIGYKWENGSFGEKRYESQFSDVQYQKTKTEPTKFDVPEGAFTE